MQRQIEQLRPAEPRAPAPTGQTERWLDALLGERTDLRARMLACAWSDGRSVLGEEDDLPRLLPWLLLEPDPDAMVVRLQREAARAPNAETLVLVDKRNAPVVRQCVLRLYEDLWPSASEVVSSERCSVCNQRTVMHDSRQLRSADEATALVVLCSMCQAVSL